MAHNLLSSDESDTESVHHLEINEHYAKAFEYRKEREELAKLKEKYGSDYDENDDEEDSEDAESEDEDGEELTPAVDAAILRTLARIKRKDPEIYAPDKNVFGEEVEKTSASKITKKRSKDKSKPLTIRQQNVDAVLHPGSRSPSPEPLTHVKEQEALRDETIAAFHGAVSGDDDDEEDLLVPRETTKDDLEKDEEEYQEFLKREVGEDIGHLITIEDDSPVKVQEEDEGEGRKEMKSKKKSKGKGKKEEADHEFLMNYILNRGWIDRSAKRLPTYQEITGSSKKGKARAENGDEPQSDSEADDEGGAGDLDDEEFEEVADRFESSYNFRFEEAGADQIARYPRNLESLVRREDSTRKEARERRKARKEEEMLKKKEEVKRLKALKLKEIRSKLERIGKEGGKRLDDTEALQDLDLEGDWDPEAHDRQMSKIYGNTEGDIEDEKPQWDDDIDVADIPGAISDDEEVSSKKKKKKKKKKVEDEYDEGGVDVDQMDADVAMDVDEEEWDGTEEMRKKKLDEYMDELYNLEFNDMVGGMPTRFKYTKVQSQSFALDPTEILLATDAELNQYMGIKKYAPYRKDGHNWDKNRASRLQELKQTINERRKAMGGGSNLAQVQPEKPTKKRKGKKERMREKAIGVDTTDGGEQGAEAEAEEPAPSGAKRKALPEDVEMGDAAPSGEQSKRKRRRHKKSAQES